MMAEDKRGCRKGQADPLDEDSPPPMCRIDEGSVPIPQNTTSPLTSNQHLNSSKDSEDDDDGDSCTENEDGDDKDDWFSSQCLCLVCPHSAVGSRAIVSHMETVHDVSLKALRKRYDMDHLSFVKMVNWQRGLKQSVPGAQGPTYLEQLINSKNASTDKCQPPWIDDQYLQPTIADDPLLQYDFESSVDEMSATFDPTSSSNLESSPSVRDTDSLKKLMSENQYLRSVIEQLQAEKEVMKSTIVRLIGSDDKVPILGSQKINNHSAGMREEEDSYYFESYDDIGIHAEMIKDFPRTGAYERAILQNWTDFKDRTVMDLGCGTGILSLFCAWAGASTIHAIDCSNIIYDAMENVFENNVNDKVRCHKGRLETMGLDVDKVDILVSEFMGYFLVYEGMLNSYIFARDKYLKPGGKMLPSSAEMLIVAVSDEETYKKEIEGWNVAYTARLLDKEFEAKMSSMKTRALKEPAIQDIKKESMASDPLVVKSLDLHTCTVADTVINNNFSLEINRDCPLTAIGGFFSVGFEDGSQHKELLSTSPMCPSTHWKQCVFYLPKRISVKKGDAIPVHFVCRPHPHNERWLAVNISVNGVNASYEMR